jgi:hypothetical protein
MLVARPSVVRVTTCGRLSGGSIAHMCAHDAAAPPPPPRQQPAARANSKHTNTAPRARWAQPSAAASACGTSAGLAQEARGREHSCGCPAAQMPMCGCAPAPHHNSPRCVLRSSACISAAPAGVARARREGRCLACAVLARTAWQAVGHQRLCAVARQHAACAQFIGASMASAAGPCVCVCVCVRIRGPERAHTGRAEVEVVLMRHACAGHVLGGRGERSLTVGLQVSPAACGQGHGCACLVSVAVRTTVHALATHCGEHTWQQAAHSADCLAARGTTQRHSSAATRHALGCAAARLTQALCTAAALQRCCRRGGGSQAAR